MRLQRTDLLLLHPPSVYDFRKMLLPPRPIADLVPSGDMFEMFPIGFSFLGEYLQRHGFKVRVSGSRYEYRFFENYVAHPANPLAYPKGLRYLQGNEVDPLVSHLVEARLHHAFNHGILGSRALIGVSYQHQAIPDLYAAETGLTETPTLSLDMAAKSFHTVAGFVQDDERLRLHERLHLRGREQEGERQPGAGDARLLLVAIGEDEEKDRLRLNSGADNRFDCIVMHG